MDTNLNAALIYLCTNAGNYFATQGAIHAANHTYLVQAAQWVGNNITASIAIICGGGFAVSHPAVRAALAALTGKFSKTITQTVTTTGAQKP